MNPHLITASFIEGRQVQEAFIAASADKVLDLVQVLVQCFSTGGKLLIFGNGGSAADAQHLAAEFVNRFLINRPPLPAIALTTDSSILTAVSNDFSYEQIFVKQIQALGRPGDVALGITTSGSSPNVIKALAVAKDLGLKTAALTGGLHLPEYCDLVLNVPSTSTPRIQEVHLWIEHLVCELVEQALFAPGS